MCLGCNRPREPAYSSTSCLPWLTGGLRSKEWQHDTEVFAHTESREPQCDLHASHLRGDNQCWEFGHLFPERYLTSQDRKECSGRVTVHVTRTAASTVRSAFTSPQASRCPEVLESIYVRRMRPGVES